MLRSRVAGRFSTGLGHQAEAQPAFRSAVHGRPPCPVGHSPRPDRARHYARIKNSFFNLFNPKNISKFPKFVETCRNVQKSKTKFCWTPLGQIYAVELTKFTFVQYLIVQNNKTSNAKINIYKYVNVQLF
jgi:hypothetical protein